MQIMTYDEHGPWGRPGPVSSIGWFTRCLDYALSVMPRERISIGLPAYGYDWNLRTKKGVTRKWKDIPALIAASKAVPKWDNATASPWFTYVDRRRQKHVVWYENVDSIQAKVRVAKARGVGVSVWAMGLEGPAAPGSVSVPSFWDAVYSA